MKKIFLLTAVLIGAASASQAGVRLNFGVTLPFGPPPEQVIISRPAPVVVSPPACETPAPVYEAPPAPVCQPAPVVVAPPRIVVAPPVMSFGFGFGEYHHRGGSSYLRWTHSHGSHYG